MKEVHLSMQKKKWVLEILGSILRRHGFVFSDTYNKNFWHFEKEVNNIIQWIDLEDISFLDVETKKRALTVWIRTSAYGSKFPLDILQFIPKECLPKPIDMLEKFYEGIPHIKDPPKDLRYWPYEDIESFKASLENLAMLVEKYGLPELIKLSIESEIIPTNEMGVNLASSYTELNKKFIRENHLEVSNVSRENIIKWFDIIEQKINDTRSEPYKNVQDMLVEITAFLGEQLRKEVGGEWKVGSEPRTIIIRNANVFASTSYAFLDRLIGSWKNQDINYFREEYLLFIESKLPVTQDFMENFHSRQMELKRFKYPSL